MELAPLSLATALTVLGWRNTARDSLRTPHLITEEQQRRWITDLPDRKDMRYFEVCVGNTPASVYGLTGIDTINGRAEISLIVNPEYMRKGIGAASLRLLFDEGFKRTRLHCLYAECYECNPNIGFWNRMSDEFDADRSIIPYTKYLSGVYHSSVIYSFVSNKIMR